jgi:hypothetical protein
MSATVYESKAGSASSTLTNGVKVWTTATSSTLAAATNALATAALSTAAYKNIIGNVVVVGFKTVATGVASTVAVNATTTGTFKDTEDAAYAVNRAAIGLTDANGQFKTFYALNDSTPASVTMTFNKRAEGRITLISKLYDGSTNTRIYLASAPGTGISGSGTITFDGYDSGAADAAAEAIDAAANLKASIEHSSGHTADQFKVDVVGPAITITQVQPIGTLGHTTITPSSVKATATITITAYTELNSTDKVNLIATDGTNYDFVNGAQSSVLGTWESTTSHAATATNLMNVINTSSGPAGTRFTATVLGAVVTVSQDAEGNAGNTAVVLTDTGTAGMSKTDFTGGEEWELSLTATAPVIFVNGVDSAAVTEQREFCLGRHSSTAAKEFIDLVNNTSHGFGTGKITATQSSGAVTLTNITGTAANTGVDLAGNFEQLCSVQFTNFTGGVDTKTTDLGIEFSVDGTNFTESVTAVANVKPNASGTVLGTVDLSSYANIPYVRFVANTTGSAVGTSWTGQFKFGTT